MPIPIDDLVQLAANRRFQKSADGDWMGWLQGMLQKGQAGADAALAYMNSSGMAPELSHALLAAAAGGTIGGLSGLLSDEEDASPVGSALTGALAAGAVGGLGSLAYNRIPAVKDFINNPFGKPPGPPVREAATPEEITAARRVAARHDLHGQAYLDQDNRVIPTPGGGANYTPIEALRVSQDPLLSPLANQTYGTLPAAAGQVAGGAVAGAGLASAGAYGFKHLLGPVARFRTANSLLKMPKTDVGTVMNTGFGAPVPQPAAPTPPAVRSGHAAALEAALARYIPTATRNHAQLAAQLASTPELREPLAAVSRHLPTPTRPSDVRSTAHRLLGLSQQERAGALDRTWGPPTAPPKPPDPPPLRPMGGSQLESAVMGASTPSFLHRWRAAARMATNPQLKSPLGQIKPHIPQTPMTWGRRLGKSVVPGLGAFAGGYLSSQIPIR